MFFSTKLLSKQVSTVFDFLNFDLTLIEAQKLWKQLKMIWSFRWIIEQSRFIDSTYTSKKGEKMTLDAKVFWKVQLIQKMSIEWLHPTIAFKKHTHIYHSRWTPMDVLWIFFWKSIIKLFQKTKDKKLWYNHCWIRQFINRWVFESIDSMFHLTTVYRYHRHL